MTAADLRALARDTMLACGARGFVRFAREGNALLVTDAASRCADGGAALVSALEGVGFTCNFAGALLEITPGDALLAQLCAREGGIRVDWENPLHPAQAFAGRLLRSEETPMTDAGRAYVLQMARLCWQDGQKVVSGMTPLREQAAALQRKRDTSGFAPAGRLLANWIDRCIL